MNQPNNFSAARSKAALPLLLAVAGIGVLAFVAGRGTAPAKTNITETAPDEHSGEHGAEGEKHEGEEHGDEHGAEEIVFEGDTMKAAGVQVAPVALSMQGSGIPFSGEIAFDPNRVVRVSSLVPGRLTRLLVSVGDRVTRGQTLAVVESRAVGEAQSAYTQALARFQNAKSNQDIVAKQARAGVFSRGPLETARRAQVEAASEVRSAQIALTQVQTAFENVSRQAKLGTFANPALEAARAQNFQATQELKASEAALSNARAAARGAQSESERRRQLAASGAYNARPLETARRELVGARSAREAAQSEVSTTRANLTRAKTLFSEGLVAGRDVEAAQQAFDTATARLQTARADESAAQNELERQQKIAASGVANNAEIGAAQSALASAQSNVAARLAQLERARQNAVLVRAALGREEKVFSGGIANRREVAQARAALDGARSTLDKARQTRQIADATHAREARIARANLNDSAQLGAARASYVSAQSDLKAARTALSLLKSAPNGRASVPIVAPLGGVVQERPVARGEVLESDEHLMTIANLSVMHVDMFLPERDIARVKVGAPVKVSVEALPGRAWQGTIELIHSELDPKTRTVEAHAQIPNDGSLRAGMAARGQIVFSQGQPAVAVPAEAVQTMEDKTVIFVQADEPNAFVAREVEPGATNGGQTVIKNGLKPGERIVVKGAFMVKAQAMKAELGHSH